MAFLVLGVPATVDGRVGAHYGAPTGDSGALRSDVHRSVANIEVLSSEVRGVLRDVMSLQPVAGATITVLESGLGVISGEDGAFRLSLSPGRWTLRVEASGYRPLEHVVRVDSDSIGLELTLDVEPVRIPGLTVSGGRLAGVAGGGSDAPSAWVVDSTVTRLLPTVAERDAFRALSYTRKLWIGP